jgi:formyl-CoA transferase
VQTSAQWEAFLKLIGRDDILGQKWNLVERVERAQFVDEMTAEWTRTKTQIEIDTILTGLNIPCSPVLDITEVSKHPQAAAREMFAETTDMFGAINGIIGVVPKLSDTPGAVEWGLMPRGAFNNEIFTDLLGFNEEQLTHLKDEGVI